MYRIAVLTNSRAQEAFWAEQILQFCAEHCLFPQMDCYHDQESFFEAARCEPLTNAVIALFPVRGKRGRSRERYGHYAAIHNTDPKFGLYTVNQYSSRRPVHRQFIGFSPKIDAHIAAHFIDKIFEGFPMS